MEKPPSRFPEVAAMRKKPLLIAAAAVLILILAVAASLPLWLDVNQFRGVLQAQLEKRLKRPVSFGELNLRSLPLSIRVQDVVIGQPAGFDSTAPFLKAGEMSVGVRFWPLLRKQLEASSVRLTSPAVELIRAPQGRWNYETGEDSGAGSNWTLGELEIRDGTVAITRDGNRTVYENIQAKANGVSAEGLQSAELGVRVPSREMTASMQAKFHRDGESTVARGAARVETKELKDPLRLQFDAAMAAGLITFRSLQAEAGALRASGQGTVDSGAKPAALSLDLETRNAPLEDVLRLAGLFGAKTPRGLSAKGRLDAQIHAGGTVEQPEFRGRIHATEAEITAANLKEAVRAGALVIDLTPRALSTTPFVVETGSTRLMARASVDAYNSKSPLVRAELQTRGAQLAELLRIAEAYGVKPEGLEGSGQLSVDMRLTLQEGKARYSGSGDVKSVSLRTPSLTKPVNIAAAHLAFESDRIRLENVSADIGSLNLNGFFSIWDFERPNIEFQANANEVNVADLRALAGSGAGTGDSSGLLEKITASGTLTVNRLVQEEIVLAPVRATVSLRGGQLRLDPVTAGFLGGEQTGSIAADLTRTPAAYQISTRIANVEANRLLSATTPVQNVLHGLLAGNLNVRFVGQKDRLAPSLSGDARIQMGEGRLAGVNLANELAGIARMLGFRKSGDAFTNILKLSGAMRMDNGLARTEDLRMDFKGGSLTAQGSVGLADQSLNLRATAVLSREFLVNATGGIPGGDKVGGWLTTALANRNGELVIPATITGTLSNPRFAPDPARVAQMKLEGMLPTAKDPDSLSSGILGIVDAIRGKPQDPAAPKSPITDIFEAFKKKPPRKKP
ncbi:MAG: AsmA family protein [Bryobacteraceae bacterium]|nr:AsmA family protein [Bryobacteraceae bacterium]